MLGSLHRQLDDHIIALLTKKGRLDAKTVYDLLNLNLQDCSLQGVYRSLRKLHSMGVVTKERKRYSISIAWLLNLSSLVQSMEETYLNEDYLSELLPESGDRHVWTFPNVFKMMNFRAQLLLAMQRQTEATVALSYTPHLWPVLIQKEPEFQFLQAFLSKVDYAYTIVGGQTYLDQYINSVMKDAFPKNHYYLAHPTDSLDLTTRSGTDVIGDFVLTTKYSEQLAGDIRHLFTNTEPLSDVDSLDILPICGHAVKVKLTLQCDARKARLTKRKFEQIFGPLEKTPGKDRLL